MEVITIHNRKYQVLNNYKDAINIEELEEKITEYFDCLRKIKIKRIQ